MTDADYNYLYGLMRSRESELIDGARLRALIGMASVEEIVQIYPDSPFLAAFAPDLDEASLERAVAAEQEELRALIDRYAPEPALRDLLLVPRDLYNLKVALRADAGAEELADAGALYGPPGTRSVAAIRAAVAGEGPSLTSAGDTDPASRALAGVLERALAAFYAAGRSGQVLELAVDRLSHLFQAATAAAVDPEVGAAYTDHARHRRRRAAGPRPRRRPALGGGALGPAGAAGTGGPGRAVRRAASGVGRPPGQLQRRAAHPAGEHRRRHRDRRRAARAAGNGRPPQRRLAFFSTLVCVRGLLSAKKAGRPRRAAAGLPGQAQGRGRGHHRRPRRRRLHAPGTGGLGRGDGPPFTCDRRAQMPPPPGRRRAAGSQLPAAGRGVDAAG